MNNIRVMLVDDEETTLDIAKKFIERIADDISVETFSGAVDAFESLRSDDYDVVVSDYQMPELDGLELLERLDEEGIDLPFIVFTGRSREEVAIKALNLGATYYVTKGGDPKSQYTELVHLIRTAVAHKAAEEKYRVLVEESNQGVQIFHLKPLKNLYVNPAMTRILGYSKEESYAWEESDFLKRVHPDDLKIATSLIEKAIEGAISREMHLIRYKHKQGHYATLEIVPRVFRYQGQNALIIFYIDKTEMQNRTRLIESINDILMQTINRRSLEDVARSALGIAEEITRSDYSFFVEINADGFVNTFYFSNELSNDLPMDESEIADLLITKKANDIWSKTLESKSPVVLKSDELSNHDFDYLLEHIDYRNYMGVPLLHGSVPIGIIGLMNREGGYSQQDIELLSMLSVSLTEALWRLRREKEMSFARDISSMYLDLLDTIFVALDKDGLVIQANKRCCELLGVTMDEIIGSDWIKEFIPKEKQNEVQTIFDSLMAGNLERFEEAENYIRTRDGEERLISWRNLYRLDNRGNILGTYSLGIDITEVRAIEDELRESELKYRTLFESTSMPVMLVDEEENYVDANPAALEFLECSLDELVSKKVWDFSLPERVEKDMEEHSPFVSRRTHETYYWVNEKVKILLLDVHPITLNDQKLLFGIGQDITDLKDAESQLLKEKEELSAFAYRMEHDIKSILQNVRGYIDLLDSDSESEVIEGVTRQVRRIDNLLTRTIQLAEAGQVIGDKEEVDLNELFSELFGEFSVEDLYFSIDNFPKVLGDRIKLEQAFGNIIGNAIEHGDPRQVSVSLSLEPGRLCISICNDGKPISEDIRPQLLTSKVSKKRNGGLGLVITKRIIEAHGWDISLVDSEQTCFMVKVPQSDVVTE